VQVHKIDHTFHACCILGKDPSHANEQIDEGPATKEVVELVFELTLQHDAQGEQVEKDTES